MIDVHTCNYFSDRCTQFFTQTDLIYCGDSSLSRFSWFTKPFSLVASEISYSSRMCLNASIFHSLSRLSILYSYTILVFSFIFQTSDRRTKLSSWLLLAPESTSQIEPSLMSCFKNDPSSKVKRLSSKNNDITSKLMQLAQYGITRCASILTWSLLRLFLLYKKSDLFLIWNRMSSLSLGHWFSYPYKINRVFLFNSDLTLNFRFACLH